MINFFWPKTDSADPTTHVALFLRATTCLAVKFRVTVSTCCQFE